MQSFFGTLTDAAIAVFAVISMLSVGLANRLQEVIQPLRNTHAVARVLLANFILAPAVAFLVLWIIPLDTSVQYGLILVSMAAGAPFLIKLSETAGASLRRTAALLVLLLPVTIVYLPLVVPLLLPGAEVSTMMVATPLVVTMLLPLAVGLLAREQWPHRASRLQPALTKISSGALIVVVVSTTIANYDALVHLDWRTVVAALLIIVGAFGVGYLSGGGDPDRREVFGLGTGQRNIAAATVVASQSFGASLTTVVVIATSLLGLAVLLPIARLLRQRELVRHGSP